MTGINFNAKINDKLRIELFHDTQAYKDSNKFLEHYGNATKFMFARNPFTRVYSAFCDKIFTGLISEISFLIDRHAHNLTDMEKKPISRLMNVSFAQALMYASKRFGSGLNKHFQPQQDFCDVCHSQYNFIGKIETFDDDLKYIMTYLNQSLLLKVMDKDQIGGSKIITDIVLRTFAKFKQVQHFSSSDTCEIKNVVLRRIWKLFQIRGFINDEKNCPLFGCDVKASYFKRLAIQAHTKAGPEAKLKSQKKNYYLMAYKSVPLDVLIHFSKSVKASCDLFGYDCYPSNVFQNRTDGVEEDNVFSNLKFT